MKYVKDLFAFILSITIVMIISGCKGDEKSGTDDTVTIIETEWEKIEAAEPAEVTLDSVSTFFKLSQIGKSFRIMEKTSGIFLGGLNLQDINTMSKSIMTTPYFYENKIEVNGSLSGTRTTQFNMDHETYEMDLVIFYDDYHDIDSNNIDLCGNSYEVEQNGSLTCEGVYDTSIDAINPIQCVFRTSFSDGKVVFARGSSFFVRDNDGDGEYEESYFRVAGTVDGEQFAYTDMNETIWNDTVYEYSLLSRGNIYFDGLSKYLAVESSFDTADSPHVTGLCNDVAYSGIQYLRGKDDALVELNISAENTMMISFDIDNDGTWDTMETKILGDTVE